MAERLTKVVEEKEETGKTKIRIIKMINNKTKTRPKTGPRIKIIRLKLQELSPT